MQQHSTTQYCIVLYCFISEPPGFVVHIYFENIEDGVIQIIIQYYIPHFGIDDAEEKEMNLNLGIQFW